jgi:hypothetical protein
MADTIENFCDTFRTEDKRMGRAYEEVGPRGRSILKSTIAALFDFYSPDAILRTSTDYAAFSEGSITCRTRPVSTVFISFRPQVAAGPLLALAVPAMTCSGAEVVCVCLEDGSPDDALHTDISAEALAGLELAGVENVLCCSENRYLEFLEGIAPAAENIEAGNHLLWMRLDNEFKKGADRTCIRSVDFFLPRIGVFCEGFNPDFEALATTFQKSTLEVWGPDTLEEHPFVERSGGFSDFCATSYDGVLVEKDAMNAAAKFFSLVMSPGSEGFWVYSQCTRQIFMHRSLSVQF